MKLPQLCELMMIDLIVLAFVATLVCAACKIVNQKECHGKLGMCPIPQQCPARQPLRSFGEGDMTKAMIIVKGKDNVP